jgi:dihydroneopterin aldolase
MGKISLEGMEFFAKHGVHEQERIIGNRYRVDVEVEAALWQAALSDKVEDTIDYGKIYRIVEKEIYKPAHLLEHLAGNILNHLFLQIAEVEKAQVSVYKYNAPVGGICTWAKVTLSKSRQEA